MAVKCAMFPVLVMTGEHSKLSPGPIADSEIAYSISKSNTGTGLKVRITVDMATIIIAVAIKYSMDLRNDFIIFLSSEL